MDKFEMEQYSQIRDLVADLQACFIAFDGERYARTPSQLEWIKASRLVHRLNLICLELYGYASACRQYNVVDIRQNLNFVSSDTQKITPNAGTLGEASEQGFVEFTEKEIKQMPTHFRKLIIVAKRRCRMRVHKSGKNATTYEIRFRRDGYNISACGKTIELAKANMIEKLKTAKPIGQSGNPQAIPTLFKDFTLYYLEKFKKPKLTELTYKNYLYKVNAHLFPVLGDRQLSKITPSDCEEILTRLKSDGKGKTADDVHSLLSIIFKGAIAHGIMDRNPLLLVPHTKHEHKHGTALTREEEKALFVRSRGTPYEIFFALALYAGLRPNELKTATVRENFIVAINSKRKNKKIEYKRIPICKKLSVFLDSIDRDLTRLDPRAEKTLSCRFPAYCPNHKLYDLRTTFYTRCKELGVADAARDEFVGHSLGVLGNTYTDLSDEYLLKEGKKLNKW